MASEIINTHPAPNLQALKKAINESTLLNQKTPRAETIMRSYCIRNLKKLKKCVTEKVSS